MEQSMKFDRSTEVESAIRAQQTFQHNAFNPRHQISIPRVDSPLVPFNFRTPMGTPAFDPNLLAVDTVLSGVGTRLYNRSDVYANDTLNFERSLLEKLVEQSPARSHGATAGFPASATSHCGAPQDTLVEKLVSTPGGPFFVHPSESCAQQPSLLQAGSIEHGILNNSSMGRAANSLASDIGLGFFVEQTNSTPNCQGIVPDTNTIQEGGRMIQSLRKPRPLPSLRAQMGSYSSTQDQDATLWKSLQNKIKRNHGLLQKQKQSQYRSVPSYLQTCQQTPSVPLAVQRTSVFPPQMAHNV